MIAPLPHFDTAGRHANAACFDFNSSVRFSLRLSLILPRCDEDLIAASSRDASFVQCDYHSSDGQESPKTPATVRAHEIASDFENIWEIWAIKGGYKVLLLYNRICNTVYRIITFPDQPLRKDSS